MKNMDDDFKKHGFKCKCYTECVRLGEMRSRNKHKRNLGIKIKPAYSVTEDFEPKCTEELGKIRDINTNLQV